MSATCAGCNDLRPDRLVVDVVDQLSGDLNGEIVFLRQRAERARHSAAARVEHSGFSTGQTLRQSPHERWIHERFGVAMRVDRDRRRPIFESKRVWFLSK